MRPEEIHGPEEVEAIALLRKLNELLKDALVVAHLERPYKAQQVVTRIPPSISSRAR
jgi:hypothetical protein